MELARKTSFKVEVTCYLHFDNVTFWKRGIALTMLVLSQTIFLHTLHQAITNYMKQKQLPLRMLLHEFDEMEIGPSFFSIEMSVIDWNFAKR